MNVIAELVAKLRLDSSQFDREMGRVAGTARRAGRGMMMAGAGLTAGVTVPLIGAAGAAVRFASDANEARNKVRVIFGSQANIIMRWAQSASTSFGMSAAEAMDAAGTFGAFFDGMGIASGAARRMSQDVIQLAGDLASFHNADPSEMLAAIRSGLSGETEPLMRFGVDLRDAALQQWALNQGISQSVQDMTTAQKAQLRYRYIMDRTRTVQGDYTNTADGAANSMRTLTAQAKDLAAKFGKVLLPFATKALVAIKGLLRWVQHLSPDMRTLAVVIGVVAAAAGPLLMVLGGVLTGITAIGAPVLLVVAGLAALAIGFYLAYKRSEGFRDAVQATMEWLKGPGLDGLKTFVAWVKEGIGEAVAWVRRVWPGVRDAIVTAAEAVVSWVRDNWPTIQAVVRAVTDTVAAYLDYLGTAIGVWQAIIERVLGVVSNLWDRFGRQWLGHVQTAFNAIVRVFQGALQIIRGVFDVFVGIFTGDWGRAWDGVKGIFGGVWNALAGIVQLALNAVSGIIGAAMAGISAAWGYVWRGIVEVLSGAWNMMYSWVSTNVEAIVGVIRTYLDIAKSVWSTAWRAVTAVVTAVWRTIRSQVSGGLNAVLTTVRTVTSTIKTVWRGMWDGMRTMARGAVSVLGNIVKGVVGAFARPLNFVIERVIQKFLDGIGRVASAIPGVNIDVPTLPTIPTRMHSGGVVGKGGPMLPGMRPDEALRTLQVGEVVLPKDVAAKLGPATVAQLIRGGASVSDAYGLLSKGASKPTGGFPNPLDALSNAASAVADTVRNIVANVAEPMIRAAVDTFDGMTRAGGKGALPAKMIQGFVHKLAFGALAWIRGADDAAKAAQATDLSALARQPLGQFGQDSGVWRQMQAALLREFPWAQVTSAFRVSYTHGSNNPSRHGYGRALDIMPSWAIFDWIADTYGRISHELIFTPAGARQLYNGASHVYSGVTAADHMDHIHWSLARGIDAVVNKPTHFIAGEAGAEHLSVKPYSPGRGYSSEGGTVINVTVQGRATRQDGQAVVDALVEWSRRNGRVPVKVTQG